MIDPAARPFLGVWDLLAIRDRLPEGAIENHPDLGPEPAGLLIYTESGHVSVQFMRRGRRPWALETEPTDSERLEAAKGFSAYAGRFEVDPAAGLVIHHVQTALIPNRVGVALRRFFSFSEDLLTLRPPRFLRHGVEIERSLLWRRRSGARRSTPGQRRRRIAGDPPGLRNGGKEVS